MKKTISLLLAVVMLLSLAACGGAPAELTSEEYKADVQAYITDVLDETAQISIFEKKSSSVDGDKLTVVCVAMYAGAAGESKGEFTLTYVKNGKSWSLDKCRVNLDGMNQVEATEPQPTEAPVEEQEEVPVVSGPVAMSDDWKDFTFELEGVVYELPTHYQNFVAQGWKLDGTRSDLTEDDKVPGYSRAYIYLTNGSVYFSADVVNLSGNARSVKDCDIGSISIEARDNINLTLTSGISCASTLEEVQAAFGTPSSINTYSDYSSVEYEVDSYVSMRFYIYTVDTKYNEITLSNMVAQERDATTPKDERPAYLDAYVAPTELSTDIKSTCFELDGVVYQLPCTLDAFTNNGWTIKSDSIGSLGAWNDTYGLTLAKGDYKINLTMINLSDFETYTKHCAVSAVSFDGYYLKDAPEDFLKLPGGVNLGSTTDSVEALYSEFTRYDGTYSTAFTYENKDYTTKVKFSYFAEEDYCSIEVKNENWEY